jgi:serine/threonine protein kinase
MKPGQSSANPSGEVQLASNLPRLAEAVRRQWEEGTYPDTAALFAQHPELLTDRSLCRDLVWEAFCLRRERGESVEPETFCRRTPSVVRSMVRLMVQVEYACTHKPELLNETQAIRWPQAGERPGDFTLLRELGRGGFSRVFLATEASTGDRPVAVKFSLHGDAEARTLGRLTHPNIVPILSARRDATGPLTAVCMPFQGSATLEDVIDYLFPSPEVRPRRAADLLAAVRAFRQEQDPPLEPASAAPRLAEGSYADGVIRIALPLVRALDFLHRRHVFHRDLKPSNVLLCPDGRPVLLDFNLSADERNDSLRLGGTLPYMAPEQIRDHLRASNGRGLDARTDLFSLGVILYQALTGLHPFHPIPLTAPVEELANYLLERQQAGFRPLRELCPEVDPSVARAIERCLAVDPTERPQSAADLVRELRRQLTLARRLQGWFARRPRRTLATGCGSLLLAATALYALATTPPYREREYHYGLEAYRVGSYEEAEAHFDQACQAAPGQYRYRFARGCARLKQCGDSRSGQKLAVLTQALKDLKPSSPGEEQDVRTQLSLAFCYALLRAHPLAIDCYEKTEQMGFRSAAVLNNRACSYILTMGLQKSAQERAWEDLEQAGRLAPSAPAVFVNRAAFAQRLRQGNIGGFLGPNALRDVERALQLSPATPGLFLCAAQLYAWSAEDLRDTLLSLETITQASGLPSAVGRTPQEYLLKRADALARLAVDSGTGPRLESPKELARSPDGPAAPARLEHLIHKSLGDMDIQLMDPLLDLPD